MRGEKAKRKSSERVFHTREKAITVCAVFNISLITNVTCHPMLLLELIISLAKSMLHFSHILNNRFSIVLLYRLEE